ncbi:MAG: PTS glucitol/sorbitol transporter subunit IIA [Spirochaetales bacterium]|nr:PTS glucitol/sorbitol transporter subunit IIA [Spirochaetales bacterium]
MSTQKYSARVTAVGEYAAEFIAEGVLVFFSETAPDELQEHAIVHDRTAPQTTDIGPADVVRIGASRFPILAVGSVANENLRNLGHLVLKFNGSDEAEMQGDVNVPEEAIPDIVPGTEIEITGD